MVRRVPAWSPGIRWYADEIVKGRPFSFVRYGEGEWRFIVPAIPEKTRGPDAFWKLKEAQNALRQTVIKCHRGDRYFPAIWHQDYLHAKGWLEPAKTWLRHNNLEWIKWHNGRVWRTATELDRVGVIVKAMRKQSLPVVVVGPKRIRRLVKEVGAAKFVQTHHSLAYFDRADIERSILKFGKPALISFSVGCTTKMLIHSLFPKIGKHSFLIDFGALWDGLCGAPSRTYQNRMGYRRIRKNWGR